MYIRPLRPDELYHWGIEKGKEKTDHKYYNRLLLGAKNGKNLYRYFYDKAAWDAYNNGKKEAKKVVNQTSKSVSNLIANSPAKSLVESGKNLFNNLFKTREKKEAEAKAAHEAEVRATDKAVAREEEKRRDPHQRSKEDKSRRAEEYKESKQKKDEYKAWKENAEKEREKNADALTKREEAIEAARQKRLNAKIETQPQGERKYKYVARIKNPNGNGYLYFYQESTYEKWLEENGGDEEELVKSFGLKKNASTEEEDMAEINEKANKNTCWSCSLSYELRRRGYDVEAVDTNKGMRQWDIMKAFKETNEVSGWLEAEDKSYEFIDDTGIKIGHDKNKASIVFSEKSNREKMASKLIDKMEKKYPEGSRGFFSIEWYGGGGHETVWEIKNGELVIRECQTNKIFKGKEASNYLSDCGGVFAKTDYVLDCIPYRTDNLTLNTSEIMSSSTKYGANRKKPMVKKN